MGNKEDNKNNDCVLNRTQMRILTEIRNNSDITKVQLMEVLGLGKTTIDRGIAALKEHGHIERVGSRKTGYWRVRDDLHAPQNG